MSFYRVGLVALTALFATAMSPGAFAGCGGCGFPMAYAAYPAPVVYAAPAPVAVPVMPAPLPVVAAPIAVANWDTGGWGAWNSWGGWGGCGCGCGCGERGLLVYAQPAVTPFYVVNQGPEYSGPGIMVPYGTYAPQAGLAVPGEYPYVGYYGRHYAYRHHYWHRPWYGPLRARD